VKSGENQPTCQMDLSPTAADFACCLLRAGFLLGLAFASFQISVDSLLKNSSVKLRSYNLNQN
jgi:hypothetical protein